MKDRTLWVIIAFMALLLAALILWPTQTPRRSPTGAASVAAVPPGSAAKKFQPEVSIQEGKTIDFSSGVAVVKDDGKQKAAIDRAVKEMESAAAGVTFAPRAPEQKKAEPSQAPPKP